MTCGIKETDIRAHQTRELVPWTDLAEVRLASLKHGDHRLAEVQVGEGGGRFVRHSIWNSSSAAKSFLKMNPGSTDAERSDLEVVRLQSELAAIKVKKSRFESGEVTDEGWDQIHDRETLLRAAMNNRLVELDKQLEEKRNG